MKHTKRIFAFFILICLVSGLGVTAFADTTTDTPDIDVNLTGSADTPDQENFAQICSEGTLNITMTVAGSFDDKKKYFEFTVNLTEKRDKDRSGRESFKVTGGSYTGNPASVKPDEAATFYLKDGETVSIANLPYGITYSVLENTPADYTLTKENDTGNIAEGVVTAVFINTREYKTTNTWIKSETIPYIVVLCVILCACIVFSVFKKRRARKEDR